MEDENHRIAPLTEENATRVMEAMRGVSFAGVVAGSVLCERDRARERERNGGGSHTGQRWSQVAGDGQQWSEGVVAVGATEREREHARERARERDSARERERTMVAGGGGRVVVALAGRCGAAERGSREREREIELQRLARGGRRGFAIFEP